MDRWRKRVLQLDPSAAKGQMLEVEGVWQPDPTESSLSRPVVLRAGNEGVEASSTASLLKELITSLGPQFEVMLRSLCIFIRSFDRELNNCFHPFSPSCRSRLWTRRWVSMARCGRWASGSATGACAPPPLPQQIPLSQWARPGAPLLTTKPIAPALSAWP